MNGVLALTISFLCFNNFEFCCQAVVAALMMNIYIVGLNQLSDVEIDKVTYVCYVIKSSSLVLRSYSMWSFCRLTNHIFRWHQGSILLKPALRL